MGTKNRAPEIRFQGFSGEWEENDLSQLIDLQSGKDYKHLTTGNIPVFGTGGYMLSVNEALSYSEDAIGIGRKGTIDKPYLLKAPFWTVDTLFYAIPKKPNQLSFLFCLFQKIDWKQKDESTGVPSLSKVAINSTQIFGTDSAEQTQIGSFFQNLDAQITLHQGKLSKLGAVKKSMLEKMFPREGVAVPEIRFKGFAGKWEKKTLGEIVTEIRRPIELKDESIYELVTVKRRNEGVVSRGELKGKQILVKNYFELRTGDYIISKRQIVHGANGLVPPQLDRAIVSNEYLVAIGNDQITTEFFALFSKRPEMYKLFFLSSYGIDIEKLVFDVDDWKKRFVVIPKLAEQQKISAFFTHLDSLITLQQRELDKLKNIKQACLEKMFV